MIHIGPVKIDRFFYQPQPQDARIKINVFLRTGGNGGYMMNTCYQLFHIKNLSGGYSFGLFNQLYFSMNFYFITYYYTSGFCYCVPGKAKIFTADFTGYCKTCFCL